jgi:hypothetical protein
MAPPDRRNRPEECRVNRTLDYVPRLVEANRPYRLTAADPALLQRSRYWTGGVVLDQGQEGSCFPPGTFVRMADGSQKAIEDVRTLDEVITAEGNTGTVLQTMARRADELVVVKLSGHLPIRCTPEHPFLTDRGYVAASKLTPVDLVAITKHQAWTADPIDTGALADMHGFRGVAAGTVNRGGIDTETTPPPPLLDKTEELGRLIGLYAAEGSVTPNKVVWSLAGHEIDTLAVEIRDLVKSTLDAEARIQLRPNGSVNVILYGKHWRLLFGALVPGTTKYGDKHLSAAVSCGPEFYLSGLLSGWLAGDGHYRRSSWQGVSVSRRLILDMHAIATSLGLRPSVAQTKPSMNRYAATRQTRYDLIIGEGGNRSASQDHRAVWRRVVSIEPEPYYGWVHNIHVQGDESYVADGVGVHNCVGHGVVGEYLASPVRGQVSHLAAERAQLGHLAAVEVYNRAKEIDEWEGVNYEGTSVRAGMLVARERGWCTGFNWAFGMLELRQALETGPVVIGVEWREESYDTQPNGDLRVGGPVAGGHCVVVTGYSPNYAGRGPRYRIRNSWGQWGKNGNGYVAPDDLDSILFQSGGEAAIPVGRHL